MVHAGFGVHPYPRRSERSRWTHNPACRSRYCRLVWRGERTARSTACCLVALVACILLGEVFPAFRRSVVPRAWAVVNSWGGVDPDTYRRILPARSMNRCWCSGRAVGAGFV